MDNNNYQGGLSLFYEELEKEGFTISEVDTSPGDSNGTIEITNPQGQTFKQNIKKLAEIYGTLTWYHLPPKQAIKEIVDLLKNQNLTSQNP